MPKQPIRVTERVELYTIAVQPGEVVLDYQLSVGLLLAAAETVSSCQVDDPDTIPTATATGQIISTEINGPANGVQVPVKLTVMGSLGSVRHIGLLIVGQDPYARLVPTVPGIYLRWRGGYSAETVYAPSDLVLYGGVIYLSNTGNAGKQPNLNITDWMPWASSGGGDGGSGILPDAGGSTRSCAFKTTWLGPGQNDWQVEVVGI